MLSTRRSRRLEIESEITPAVNQIELHPYFTRETLRAVNNGNAIATEAWSPIAQGAVLKDPVINELAASYERTPAQIVLRWHIELGNIVFPRSVTPTRVAENFDLFGFELAAHDMERISSLDKDERQGPDPDTFDMIPG
jgi:2,5-diketo-D-gluconate reductase A